MRQTNASWSCLKDLIDKNDIQFEIPKIVLYKYMPNEIILCIHNIKLGNMSGRF